MIHVKYYGKMRSLTGRTEELLAVDRIDRLVKEIGFNHGSEASKAAKRSSVLLNGKNVALINGYRTRLHQGDVVQIMPVAAGG